MDPTTEPIMVVDAELARPPKTAPPWWTGYGLGALTILIVGAALYFTDVLRFGEPGAVAAAVDTTPVSMPKELGGLPVLATAMEALFPGNEVQRRTSAHAAEWDLTMAETLAAAYSGAGASIETYSKWTDGRFVRATAVRGESPRLFVPYQADREMTGLATSPEEVHSAGEVDCYILNTKSTVAGNTPDPAGSRITHCQRTGPGLTVRIYPTRLPSKGYPGIETAVAVTNELWDAVSGQTSD